MLRRINERDADLDKRQEIGIILIELDPTSSDALYNPGSPQTKDWKPDGMFTTKSYGPPTPSEWSSMIASYEDHTRTDLPYTATSTSLLPLTSSFETRLIPSGTSANPPVASDQSPYPTSSVPVRPGPSFPSIAQHQGNSNHTAILAAAAVIPLVILGILGVIIFFCLRRRRRQRQKNAAIGTSQEMKMNNNTSGPPPQYEARPQYAEAQAPSPSTASPTTPQPVILGPIVSGSNGAYLTGIDTSDVASMHDTSGLVNPFADRADQPDEPPPPYRPRSLAPLSRDTSLRQSQPAVHSQTNLIQGAAQHSRSPFEDPEEDDAVSEISEPTDRRFGERDEDVISVVSDLSYQADPLVTRPNV